MDLPSQQVVLGRHMRQVLGGAFAKVQQHSIRDLQSTLEKAKGKAPGTRRQPIRGCNGITQTDFFPGVALRLFFVFNVFVSHPNMHNSARSITEPLLNLILLFCEKTRCFYHKIPSRFNANHIDKSQIKRACAAMQACAEFHYIPLTSHVQGAEAPGTGLTRGLMDSA